ncbi:MAG TPA: hypothetical protein VFO38_02345 [Candidatus Saccharimonadales bacterium]|nr:hypothetical protein [Candidatus Saccharimonadales bacterium]
MNIRKHLTIVNDIATKRVVKQFCTKYHLVYFGHVDAREDDHQLVRGITASTSHTDNHYSVGTFDGHDIMLVQRRNTLTFPGKPDAEYKWLILQVDLKRGDMPHLFIDAHRHDETFYANLFVKIPKFQDIRGLIPLPDATFTSKYKVFALPNQYQQVSGVLVPELTSTIAHHFGQFDFEIIDDRLYVYGSAHVVTFSALQEMLQAGIWVASYLNTLKIPA